MAREEGQSFVKDLNLHSGSQGNFIFLMLLILWDFKMHQSLGHEASASQQLVQNTL